MTKQHLRQNASSNIFCEKQAPNQLTSKEYHELHQGSGIHPDIIDLNFFHLKGDIALDRLFISERLPRINTGALSYSILKRYRHIEAGGWWVSGVDVLNNYTDDPWGQFKPLQPRLSADKGKPIKYEAPPKHPTGIIALKVSNQLWHKVARLNKVKLFLSSLTLRLRDRTAPISFWEWVVSNPEIPLIITEGAKKAAALLSLGYAAIALPGVFNGYRQPKDELGRKTGVAKLIPQLQVFATPGRTVYFAFDCDTKATTIANVNKAIAKTGKLLTKAGVNVKVIRWLEPDGHIKYLNQVQMYCPPKGVDDLIVNYGAEAFHQAYNAALSLKTWLVKTQVQLTYPINIRVNRRYLGSLTDTEIEMSSNKTDGKRATPRRRQAHWVTLKRQMAKKTFVCENTVLHAESSRAQRTQNDNPLETHPTQVSHHTLNIPNIAKLVCLKSPKGTGKTHLLEQVVDKAITEGKWVLLLTHRIQLGEALCQRVGLPYLREIKTVEYGTVLGYGLCIDSLHPLSGARFNADHWQDGVVIIDEAEQVIWHLLNSETCSSERVEILAQFKTLIQNTLSGDGRVYLADADLSDIAIDYIRSLAGFHVEPFVVVNDWQPSEDERWTVYNYEDKNPARLVRDLLQHIEAGGKPFISCSAQKIQSKWGTQNLESYLQFLFPDKKILRIDSETVADPSHPAMGCIAHLNEILPQYDIAIASPSIETGVSIECERQIIPHCQIPLAFQFLLWGIETSLGRVQKISHFDSVWAIAQGVQAADSIRQALARIRAHVPRYLWAAKRGFYKCMVGNGATIKKALLASTKNKASTNIRFLQAADASIADLDLDTNFQPESLNTWARRGCYINLTMQNYRSSIVEGLITEGHLVTTPPEPPEENCSPAPEIESQLKQVAQTKYQAECIQVVNAPTPNDSEYQKLKDKRAKTREERWIERKGNLVRRYGNGISITPELVALDDKGWYSQLLSHYYLTVGRPYLIGRDSRHIKALAPRLAFGETSERSASLRRSSLRRTPCPSPRCTASNQNRLWLPDFNRSLLSTSLRLLETLIIGLLQPRVQYRGSDPNLQLIAELAKANQRELKTFLGLTISESDTPIKIAQKLLSLLGLKLTCIGRLGSRTQRERVYVFEPPDDGREEIFAHWLQRDRALTLTESAPVASAANLSSVSTIGKDNNLLPVMDSKFKPKNPDNKQNTAHKWSKRTQQATPHPIQPGAVVEWLVAKGKWIVKASTGIVAKIIDSYGKEVLVNCCELKLC
ncbi:DUF3854 domain-containing protein [Pleurocapsales cyanobacterium LEGE 06147]|nr:DUF3854 domain-containing protein [Pleurocapsales cyanobacterium LEGE 06147]